MRIALAITQPGYSKEKNLAEIIQCIHTASRKKADLILFAEAAYTGLRITDNPQKDKPLFVSIPGIITDQITKIVQEKQINVGIGLLEIEKGKYFDSAILINKLGQIILKYHRNSAGWHSPKAQKEFYSEGSTIPFVEFEFGKVAFLLCGDLFESKIIKQVQKMNLDYLFLPLARSLKNDENIQTTWDKEIQNGYIPQIRKLKVKTLLVNYYSPEFIDNNFLPIGGAAIISSLGDIIDSYPICQKGLLIANI